MRATDYRTDQARAMSEDELTELVRETCKALGIFRFHPLRSKGNQPGWPDEALIGPTRLLFRELKRESGVVSAAQRDCMARLRAAGQDVDLWRPSDWFSGRIQRELRELARASDGPGELPLGDVEWDASGRVRPVVDMELPGGAA